MEKPNIIVELNQQIDLKDEASKSESSLEESLPIPSDNVPLMDLDNGLVGWDSLTDTANPQNWSTTKKSILMAFMAVISMLSPLTSTLVAPGIPLAMRDLHSPSPIIGSFMVTIYMLGFTIGPLFLGPLSEIYGRYPIVILSTWFYVIWLLGCALAPTMSSLIVMRLLAGTGGSAVMVIAPAIVADLYSVRRRATASSVVVLTQSVGPALGPICGGFIAQELGWRWGYWILLIVAGSVTAGMTVCMPESYAPKILQKKTERLRKSTGRADLRSMLDKRMSKKALLARSIVRPVKLLTTSPIVILICSYCATIFGFLYLMMTTIPQVFSSTYGWTTSYVGLAYTPIGLGMITALLVIMKTNDAKVIKLTKQNNNVFEPEMRLPATIYFAIWIPISLFWYGWSVDKHTHWIVPILGMFPFGFGMLGIFLPCQTYLVDAFTEYSASAVAVSRASMSIVGAFLPLAGPPLYKALGYGLGNSVLGLVSLVMAPIPILLYKYGGYIRRRWPVTL
ncbi:MFS general substrate transporter [Microthyrium microscopicum]|uniref:MFS general substrate transporter n=1 Tax=Microthyrium microscopicum TaxID=703497 RepID=A0A6A6UHF3_9PEZI|nr:MFS general substrate transporter [Microthyrium microscopicum]